VDAEAVKQEVVLEEEEDGKEEGEEEGEEAEDFTDAYTTETDNDDSDYNDGEKDESPRVDDVDLPVTPLLSPSIGGVGHLEEGEIPREAVVAEPSVEAESPRKKLRMKLSIAAAMTSMVQAPSVPVSRALSPDYDPEMFVALSSLPLPDFETLTEIDNYNIAMTSKEYNFNEYGTLGDNWTPAHAYIACIAS